MTEKICRVGDTVTGTCSANAEGHPRTFTGTWTTGSDITKINGIQVVRVNDIGITDCGHTFKAASGSTTSKENGIPFMRVGDPVIVLEGGSGVAITGSGIMSSD